MTNNRILLIEDNPLIGQMLNRGLAQNGFDVQIASGGGDEGLVMAVTASPGLIVLDTDIPVINGWQAIKILKASRVTRNIPIVALVGPNTPETVISQSECDAYISKPIYLEGLLEKIRQLQGTSAASAGAAMPAPPAPPAVAVPKPKVETAPKPLTPRRPSATERIAKPDPREILALPKPMERTTVVYVEDSAEDSRAMAEVIEGAGYTYANISDSLHALPQLLELKPRLIFLDLVMPVANGYELCSQIRRISAFRKTPIIIVTNNDGIADRVRAKVVGASGFFGKPIQERRVLKVLQKHLQPVYRDVSNGAYQQRPFFLS